MQGKRVRRGADEWRAIVDRQAASGIGVEDFCTSEGLSRSVFNRWRLRFTGPVRAPRPRPTKASTPFIEVGQLGMSRETLRLELGSGIVLTVSRG